MVRDIEFVLLFENGHTKTFASLTDAKRYVESIRSFPRPRKLIRREIVTKTTTVRSWE